MISTNGHVSSNSADGRGWFSSADGWGWFSSADGWAWTKAHTFVFKETMRVVLILPQGVQ